MATEYVEQDKQPEQSKDSSPSGWNVTTSRMVIEFYKENRILWDRNHKDYGKNSLQKKAFAPLVAKLDTHCRFQHLLSTCLYSSSSNSIIIRTKSFFLFNLRCIRWSAMLNLESSSHFPSSKFACVHRTSVLSKRLVAAAVQTERLVAAMCRSDLSHNVSRPLTFSCG